MTAVASDPTFFVRAGLMYCKHADVGLWGCVNALYVLLLHIVKNIFVFYAYSIAYSIAIPCKLPHAVQ